MDRFLEARTAWVTDGLNPIGRASALALADAGAHVAFGSPSDSREAVQALSSAISERGVRCFASAIDLGSDAEVDRFHGATVAALGPVDILINSAGLTAKEAMIGHRDEVWDTLLDINLHASYRTTKRCMASMIERRYGRIVNIASTAAEVGYAGHGAYCAAKAALLGLTRCVALEGAEHGVTCNALNPGWVGDEPGRDRPEEMPQRRQIPAEEVAAFIVFLCREEAFGLTAEAVGITGGSATVAAADGAIW